MMPSLFGTSVNPTRIDPNPNSPELQQLEIQELIYEYHKYADNPKYGKSYLARLYKERDNYADQAERPWEKGIASRDFITRRHSLKGTLDFPTYKKIRGWRRMITRMNGHPIHIPDAEFNDIYFYNQFVYDINQNVQHSSDYLQPIINSFSEELDDIQDYINQGLKLTDPIGPPRRPPITYNEPEITEAPEEPKYTTVKGGRKKYKKTYKTRKHRKHRKSRKH